MGKICTFFGHRSIEDDKGIRARLDILLIDLITRHNVDTFFVGELGNFERMAFRQLMCLKKKYPHIELNLICAYYRQLLEAQRMLFYDNAILPVSRQVRRAAIPQRNKWVVQNCDMAICYIDIPMGGAYKAFCDLQKLHKPVYNLASDLALNGFPMSDNELMA